MREKNYIALSKFLNDNYLSGKLLYYLLRALILSVKLSENAVTTDLALSQL